MKKAGINGVRNWYAREELLSRKCSLIPINHYNTHWTLAVVDLLNRKRYYYDSLCFTSESRKAYIIMNKIIEYIEQMKFKKIQNLFYSKTDAVGVLAFLLSKTYLNQTNENPFTLTGPNRFLPRQFDGNSCGAFICKFAKVFVRNESLILRSMMLNYIVNKY